MYYWASDLKLYFQEFDLFLQITYYGNLMPVLVRKVKGVIDCDISLQGV